MFIEIRRDVGSPGTGVMDGCEPQCGFWELNLSVMQEQQVLLPAEPCL
jgi:E3 ubiquitin-protein ligase NEDD4